MSNPAYPAKLPTLLLDAGVDVLFRCVCGRAVDTGNWSVDEGKVTEVNARCPRCDREYTVQLRLTVAIGGTDVS